MSAQQLLILAILAVTVGLFLWGRWRHDMVAVAALLACVLRGLVPADDAFRGFLAERGTKHLPLADVTALLPAVAVLRLPAAAILSIALLAQLAGQWQLQRRQQQQLQTLEAGTEALFRQTFPEIKRLLIA